MEAPQVVALVPARAGSKGIPGKNLRVIAGRSLLAWTVELALSIPEIDRCIVSTDGSDIADEARQLGADVHVRLPGIATDSSLVIDTVRAVFTDRAGAPAGVICVLLQPTSPLRSQDDVRRCVQAVQDGADTATTVSQARTHPDLAMRIDDDGALQPYIRDVIPWQPRQHLARAYELNGSVYAFWPDRLTADDKSILHGRIVPVVVDPRRGVDIDDQVDLALVQMLADRLEQIT